VCSYPSGLWYELPHFVLWFLLSLLY
jgi:hypothetical protein